MSKRKRTRSREDDRAAEKMARDLEKLAALAPGGAPDRALVIDSPSEVEVHARSTLCPVCQGELRVEDHTAETHGGLRLRVAKVVCGVCRRGRVLYFQLRSARLN